MANKKVIAYINTENDIDTSVLNLCINYANSDADELFIYNYSKEDEDMENLFALAREVSAHVDIPFTLGLRCKRLEDVKKALYAGADKVMIKLSILDNIKLIKEASDRFGKNKIVVEVDDTDELINGGLSEELEELGAYAIMLKHTEISAKLIDAVANAKQPVYFRDSLTNNDIYELISMDNVVGVITNYFENKSIVAAKKALREQGVDIKIFESSLYVTFSLE